MHYHFAIYNPGIRETDGVNVSEIFGLKEAAKSANNIIGQSSESPLVVGI